MNTPNPNDSAALDQAHVLRPWANFGQTTRDRPTVLTRGQGARVWDAEGREYLDAVGGLWCTNIGLGRTEMAQAIAAQAERLAFSSTFVDMTNDPAARLAGRLVEIAPKGMSHVHFTTGGSTALDSAFRMVQFAQAAMGRPEKMHMIARHHAYHGATYAAASLGRRPGDRAPEFGYEAGMIHHVSAPYSYRDEGDPADFSDRLVAEFEAEIARLGRENVGGFFAEPIQASGGVLVPPEDYLPRMKSVCEAHDILYVSDEVVTAFGRLGEWFSTETVFGVTPDIICCAKGLSSGYQPIGAVLFSDRIWDAMANDPERWYTSGFTYSGHPVACAAALKNIEIIERENLLAHVRRLGPVLQSRLAELRDLPLVGDVRGMGFMACIENVANKASRELLPAELDIGRRITLASEARGLMVRPIGHLNVMSPALIIDEDDIAFIGDTLAAAIRSVADDLTRAGIGID